MSFFARKVVTITGSSNGIGRSTAEFFARAGARLTITGRNVESLEETRGLCLKAGVKDEDIFQLTGQITDASFNERLISETVEKFGQLDVLVNNAGGTVFDMTGKKGIDVPLENYDRIMDINVRSVLRLSQLAVPHLEKTKGAIVNVSSIAALPLASSDAYYAASKSALDQLTVQMAATLIGKDIRVNSVNPGVILTNFAASVGLPKEKMEELFNQMFADCSSVIPLGRYGQAEDIAKIILFLADRSQSEIIVGQRIIADGGSVLKNCLFSIG
ncbi:hypothetical protein PENTCL1PPCAC_21950 [Pristionchus entomophagus]|uniref:Ketoreductase domain-containing protein n=1 Tax=Pristionchus entomophagus TaxID=358040 RepID=A0AAV5TYY6_9BILA|nr:hypothetical protein PENTCL1PPCAC_21950 [Pristionchus entomophagus]